VDRNEIGRRIVTWLGTAIGIIVVALALFALLGPAQQHIGM